MTSLYYLYMVKRLPSLLHIELTNVQSFKREKKERKKNNNTTRSKKQNKTKQKQTNKGEFLKIFSLWHVFSKVHILFRYIEILTIHCLYNHFFLYCKAHDVKLLACFSFSFSLLYNYLPSQWNIFAEKLFFPFPMSIGI